MKSHDLTTKRLFDHVRLTEITAVEAALVTLTFHHYPVVVRQELLEEELRGHLIAKFRKLTIERHIVIKNVMVTSLRRQNVIRTSIVRRFYMLGFIHCYINNRYSGGKCMHLLATE